MVSNLGGNRVLYVATADVSGDEDLARRVREHRKRRPKAWETVDATANLSGVFEEVADHDAVLVDSLALWVSDRMRASENREEILRAFDAFLEAAGKAPMPLVLVSDEVGLGVIPESSAGRGFRDLLGLVNQRAAASAEEVHLCVAGLGLRIK